MEIKSLLNNIQSDMKKNTQVYFWLFFILVGGFILRVYRVDQLLGFYFDQGRDAKVIWDLWHNGQFFLIGPTTGIEGIFRGPWYYWLIAPSYLIGQGNPIWPSVFLSFTTVLASLLAFLIGRKIHSNIAGLLAAFISCFSFALIISSRWLSNPTPMFLISMILVYSLILVSEGKKWAWILIGLVLGMAMQFGSAAEIFYFPTVIIFGLLNKKYLPTLKIAIIAILAVIFAFVPQIIFDLKHEGILRAGLSKFLLKEENFNVSFWETVKFRLPFYYGVFFGKIFHGFEQTKALFTVLIGVLTMVHLKNLFKNPGFQAILLLLLTSTFGMLFFQGNYGNVYDYYFTGYYLVFVLFISVLLAQLFGSDVGKLVLAIFLFFFLQSNWEVTSWSLSAGVDGSNHLSLGNQIQSVDWVYGDAKGKEFNADFYVPPVIPHAYNYLFLWKGYSRCGENLCKLNLDSNVPLLYTLYEVDPPHPERLDVWLARQKGIGIVEETQKFGGITIERRKRI